MNVGPVLGLIAVIGSNVWQMIHPTLLEWYVPIGIDLGATAVETADFGPVCCCGRVPVVQADRLSSTPVIVVVAQVVAVVLVVEHRGVPQEAFHRPGCVIMIARSALLVPLFAIALAHEADVVVAAKDSTGHSLEGVVIIPPPLEHIVEIGRRWALVGCLALTYIYIYKYIYV